ncbi:ARL14 effector protein-like isoform X2 [Glandiceps talaboti]
MSDDFLGVSHARYFNIFSSTQECHRCVFVTLPISGSPQLKATQRLLRSLQFKNPGPLSYSFACFNPETSEREMRKLRRVMHPENASRQKPKKSTIYDDSGRLIEDGRDLCDCLDDLCPGCHYPCPQCESTKCGSECRCNRRWLYEQIEVEGSGEVIKFHSSKSGHNKRS